MKAAVFHGIKDIRVEEVPIPPVQSNGVLVKVKATGICGSDLHPYRIGGVPGTVHGHEFSGDVVEVGANVSNVSEGDRVVGIPFSVCNQCHWCKQELYARCSDLHLPGWPDISGAQAEYTAVPALPGDLSIVKLPDNLSYEEGAAIEPLSVAVYGVTRAKVQPDDRVVVIGAGMIGLCIVQALRAIGVSQIIVSGRRSKRLELAKTCGADIVVDAAKDDIVSVVKDTWPDTLADVVFETAGVETTFQQSLAIVHPGGKVVLEGIFEQAFKWNPTTAVLKDVDLIACFGEDFAGSVDLLSKGKADMKPLISHEFPLDQAKQGYDAALEAEDAIKVLLKP